MLLLLSSRPANLPCLLLQPRRFPVPAFYCSHVSSRTRLLPKPRHSRPRLLLQPRQVPYQPSAVYCSHVSSGPGPLRSTAASSVPVLALCLLLQPRQFLYWTLASHCSHDLIENGPFPQPLTTATKSFALHCMHRFNASTVHCSSSNGPSSLLHC